VAPTPNRTQITLEMDAIQRIAHGMANAAAVAESALSMAELDRRLPEALRPDIQDAATATRTMSALVIEFQKLVGLR
jgi:hypothetical protein